MTEKDGKKEKEGGMETGEKIGLTVGKEESCCGVS